MSSKMTGEVTELLYTEARLLDERDFEAWQQLFTDDAHYWLPMDDGSSDPMRVPSLIYDDRQRIRERVFRLLKTQAYAQIPPSATVHQVSNIVTHKRGPDRCVVESVQVIHDLRGGDYRQSGLGTERVISGRAEHHLRRIDGEWRIELKKVLLLGRAQPFNNLSYIV